MITASEVFRIGRLHKPHGLGGEISFSFTDDVFDRTESPYWVMEIDGILVPFFLESYRFSGETGALVKFLDMDDAEAVRLLCDHDVYYPKRYADSPSEETLTWRDFIGWKVSDSKMGYLGQVSDVDDSTLNVLFALKTEQGDGLILPANEDLMERVDEAAHCLVMNLPEGLLNPEEE